MSMNNGTKGVHICRVARIAALAPGERPSMAERNQRLRAMAERLKGSGSQLADANNKEPHPMNAETRAKELTIRFARENMVEMAGGDWEALEDLIAAAIRQAENDKLEEAADAATKFLVGDPFNGVPLRSPGPHEIAAHIRSLKSGDT